MKQIFLLLTAVIVMYGCSGNSNQAPATGNPYELILVTPPAIYHSAVGDTLKSIFGEEVRGISRSEKIYDMYTVSPNAIKTLAGKHRNLLFVNVNEKFGVCEFYADTNKYAKGQLAIYFQGPTVDSVANFIYKNRGYMVGLLDKYEQDRFVKRLATYNEKGLEALILKKFDMEIKIPKGYRVKNDEDNFLWLSFETTLGSLGIVIYTFNQAPNGEDWLLDQRDVAINKIPGPSEGSFATTERRFRPETKLSDLYGRQWFVTRGLWAVEKDFMGGPFINYVTFANGHYIGIDCFVQEPDVNKTHRNYIRQFESLPLTIKFPNDKSNVEVK